MMPLRKLPSDSGYFINAVIKYHLCVDITFLVALLTILLGEALYIELLKRTILLLQLLLKFASSENNHRFFDISIYLRLTLGLK